MALTSAIDKMEIEVKNEVVSPQPGIYLALLNVRALRARAR